MAKQSDTTNLSIPRGKPTGNIRMRALGELPTESLYATKLVGDCMEPLFDAGCRVVGTSSRHPVNGEYVLVFLHGVETPLLKRAVMIPPLIMMDIKPGGNVTPLVIVEQINPSRTYQFPVDRIESIHPVVAVAPAGSDVAISVDEFLAGRKAA